MSDRRRLRSTWLNIHKWIGLILALLIVPISLSGAALVWKDQLDTALHPARAAVTGPARLAPSAYQAAARAALTPEDRIVSLRIPAGWEAVTATAVRAGGRAGRGPSARTSLWLDPATGRLLDRQAGMSGPIGIVHRLHGSLLVPGAGRQVVGIIGFAMLLSSLTGLWLWWPLTGRWTSGLRWRRRGDMNANLHHRIGFWIALPLFMLSLTGAWISFPQIFDRQPAGAGATRNAPPLAAPNLSLDAAIQAAAGPRAGRVTAIAWPTGKSPLWRISVAGRRGEIAVDDATGKPAAGLPRASGGSLSQAMRRWHDGDGMGSVWQTIIFLAGLAPAILAVTGIVMWARSRRWRKRPARRDAREAPAAV
ncbi:MAG TPA: PepSY-associated TM helix domain-containing protein [Allosphingosinicella sp.]|jgi:uncharacterized iron-regulated membrane protein